LRRFLAGAGTNDVTGGPISFNANSTNFSKHPQNGRLLRGGESRWKVHSHRASKGIQKANVKIRDWGEAFEQEFNMQPRHCRDFPLHGNVQDGMAFSFTGNNDSSTRSVTGVVYTESAALAFEI